MEQLGKTLNIASRFPHFYDTQNSESLLYQFINVFGQILEQAENDLMAVMRAHHIDTATNEDSQGFTGKRKGDLDKIFTLYLETLGGTSQLIQISDRFGVGSLKNINSLVKQLETNTNPVSQYLRSHFTQHTQDILSRYQTTQLKFHKDSFKNLPQLAISILVAQTPLSQYIKNQLDEPSQKLLNLYDGRDPVSPDLQELLILLLNQRLTDPYLYHKNKAYFQSLPLLETVKQLIANPANPEDRLRLNRLLLEAAYPQLIHPSKIPSKGEVEHALVQELNRFLEAYNPQDLALDSNQLITENRLLLESTYPNELEKSYAPYRERLKGIIAILRQGAATRQGILDLVAANLGILGTSDAAIAAKNQIRLEEFASEITWVRPPNTSFNIRNYRYSLSLFEEFIAASPNPQASEIEFLLEVTPDLPVKELYNPKIVHLDTGEFVCYEGSVKPGDLLLFRKDTVLVNGKPYHLKNPTPSLPRDSSRWRFEAQLIQPNPVGLFDQQKFNFSTLSFAETAVYLEGRVYKLNPGIFEVTIPWDIPGYTDKFAEADDHPRNQITNIINHVKAAGVLAIINYEKIFQEQHDTQIQLTIERSPFLEDQSTQDELNFIGLKTPYPKGIHHELSDHFLTTGVFDYARFDCGNRFPAVPDPYPGESHHELSDNFFICGVFDYTEFDSGNGFE